MIPRLYTAKELADRWNVSETWVLERVPSIKLHGLRRFEEQAVQEWLAQQRSEGEELAEVSSIGEHLAESRAMEEWKERKARA